MWQIAAHRDFGSAPPAYVIAHGEAQLWGVVSLFVMGVWICRGLLDSASLLLMSLTGYEAFVVGSATGRASLDRGSSRPTGTRYLERARSVPDELTIASFAAHEDFDPSQFVAMINDWLTDSPAADSVSISTNRSQYCDREKSPK